MSSQVYSGQGEVTRVRFLGTDGFEAGTDTPLIGLYRAWESRRNGPLLSESEVLLTDTLLARVFGYLHIVNVRPDSPDGYVFESYGFRARVAEAADFTGRRLA